MKIAEMLNVGEYTASVDLRSGEKGELNVLGYAEPIDRRWIIFFNADGTAHLYTKRCDGGGVIGDPIVI